MKITTFLVFSAAVLSANAATAQTACTKPTEPAAVDGKGSTMDQLLAAKTSVTGFIAASDTWQTCALADLKTRQDAAKAASMPLDPSVEKGVHDSIADNQAAKERVGKWFNTAVKDYKTAHPG